MEEKSVANVKGMDKQGFVWTLTARAEDVDHATDDIINQIDKLGLTPWHQGRNMFEAQSLTDLARELGGQVHLGEKVLPPTDAEAGDIYDMGVSLYSYDGEYLKFYKRIKEKGSSEMVITQWPVLSLKLAEGNKDLEVFNEVWPDWGEPEVGSKLELPVGLQMLTLSVGPNKKSSGNFYHNLVSARSIDQ